MSFLSAGIAEALEEYFARPGGIAYVISPYIETGAFQTCMTSRRDGDVVVVTSWRADLLIQGVSSLDLFPACQKEGWTLLVNDDLHAKFYSHSLESAWVGSANMTRPGVGLPGAARANVEILQCVEPLERAMRVWLHGLISCSKLVTVEWWQRLRAWLDEQQRADEARSEGSVPERPETSDPFLVSQLPATASPSELWEAISRDSTAEELTAAEHDLGIYSVRALSGRRDDLLESLAQGFFGHPFIRALDERVGTEGARFGAVKEWIQDTCADVPVPYRRALTESTQILYRWFCELAPNDFEVVRPRHTQILRRRH